MNDKTNFTRLVERFVQAAIDRHLKGRKDPDDWGLIDAEFNRARTALMDFFDHMMKCKLALQGIIEIGKRDTSNPKYDGYFREARKALGKD